MTVNRFQLLETNLDTTIKPDKKNTYTDTKLVNKKTADILKMFVSSINLPLVARGTGVTSHTCFNSAICINGGNEARGLAFSVSFYSIIGND